MFRINDAEKEELVTNCDRFKPLKYSSSFPYAFTEHGALMSANILSSKKAIQVSILICRSFCKTKKNNLYSFRIS